MISLRLSELVAEVNNISDYELVDSVEPPTPARVQPKAKAIPRSPVREVALDRGSVGTCISDSAREDAARATGRFFAGA